MCDVEYALFMCIMLISCICFTAVSSAVSFIVSKWFLVDLLELALFGFFFVVFFCTYSCIGPVAMSHIAGDQRIPTYFMPIYKVLRYTHLPIYKVYYRSCISMPIYLQCVPIYSCVFHTSLPTLCVTTIHYCQHAFGLIYK